MKIAIMVSTVGYHWQELYDAFHEFRKAGLEIDVFTVNGLPPSADPLSVRHTGPLSLVGLGIPKTIDPSSQGGQELLAALTRVRPISELTPHRYEAIYLPGGHGCLFDVNRNETLHQKVADLYRGGKILSAVCHATSTFAFVTVFGNSIVAGKELTGFPQVMDDLLISAGGVDTRYLPLPLSNEHVLRRAGARLPKLDPLRATMNPRHMCISLPFVTGVGPKAARPVARAVIAELRHRTGARLAA